MFMPIFEIVKTPLKIPCKLISFELTHIATIDWGPPHTTIIHQNLTHTTNVQQSHAHTTTTQKNPLHTTIVH